MLQKKPYVVLWFLGAVLAIAFSVSYVLKIDTNLVINRYDSYIVIAHSYLFLLFSVWFLLCGLGYFILQKFKAKPIYTLTILHLLFTLLSLLGIFFDQFTNSDRVESILVWVSIVLFPVGQLLYFVHIMLSTLLKFKTKKSSF